MECMRGRGFDVSECQARGSISQGEARAAETQKPNNPETQPLTTDNRAGWLLFPVRCGGKTA